MLPAVSCYIHKCIYSYLNTSPACHANHENSKIPFYLINQLIFGHCPARSEQHEITLFFGLNHTKTIVNNVKQHKLCFMVPRVQMN